VTPRQPIFISAVSKELRSARQLVANTLQFLGYEPVWQDIFGTEQGDLREMLRKQVDQCKGVVQLLGQCYGAEPPVSDEQFGRVSYTQYEALYARHKGKKVWYLVLDEHFTADAHEPEPPELRELQAAYTRRVKADMHLFHPLGTPEALEANVLKLRDDLAKLRRGVKQWAIGVVLLLVLIAALVIWLVHTQRNQSGVILKQGEQMNAIVDRYQKMQQALTRLADVEAQSKQPGAKSSPEEQRAKAYAILEKELGLPAGSLSKELPGFALELYSRTDTTPLLRARAAYALGKFDEAQKLSLEGAAQDVKAYETAQRVQQDRRKSAIEGYKLAGQSAQKLIQYNEAMSHFREAEKLTDREREPEEWAEVQDAIANLLIDQGQYKSAETLLRPVVEVRARVLGPENPETLRSRNRLNVALWRQAKFTEAEGGFRELIKIQEKVLGPEHPDTLLTRNGLANIFYDQGHYAESEGEHRAILKIRERVLGPEHPDTLKSRSNVANVLDTQGKYAESEAQYREVIKIREKVLGPEHPDTLRGRSNLAAVFYEQGKFAEAEAQFREIMLAQEKVLGPEHPDTIRSRNNLADVADELGRHADAEALDRELIKIREKVLGPEHPETLRSRKNLAIALSGQGRDTEAETQFREMIKIQERVEGPEHPDTLDCYYYFAVVLKHQNKLQEAKESARRAVEGARKVLPPNHPYTQRYEKLLRELEAQ